MSKHTQDKRVGDMFGGHAKLYAAARPTYPDELFEYIVSLSPDVDKVWDCAAGTGQATVELAKYFAQVEASDINAEQVATAKERYSNLGNVNFSVQTAEKTSFPDNSFDVLTVAQALHWFDHSDFWPEVRRVLKPCGLFAAWGYDWTRTDFHSNHCLEQNLFEILKPFWSEKAKTLWNGYKSEEVAFPFDRIERPRISIKMHWDLPALIGYFRSWSSTQKAIKECGNDDFFIEATRTIVDVWGHPDTKKIIEFPLHLCFGLNK